MKEILLLGALPTDQKSREFYEFLAKCLVKYAKKVYSPLDTEKFKGSDLERYTRAFKRVKASDLIIGEQSKPSTGQGMELREAAVLNKPIIVLAKKGSFVSGLIKGCPQVKKIVYYEQMKDLQGQLEELLKKPI